MSNTDTSQAFNKPCIRVDTDYNSYDYFRYIVNMDFSVNTFINKIFFEFAGLCLLQ